MFVGHVDIPTWVSIPSSEMGQTYHWGKVVEVWRNQIKVEWYDSDLTPHIGIYGIAGQVIRPMPSHANEKYVKYLAKCTEETQARCRDLDAKIWILLEAM